MFAYQDVIDNIKSLVDSLDWDGLSRCQMLELHSRRLGFESYHHLRTSLKGASPDQIGAYSIKLIRKICASRLPMVDSSYFKFWSFREGPIGYYSYWIGWDKNGEEVRVPRPLDGRPSTEGLRRTNNDPIYVIESDREVVCWRHLWGGVALMPEELAKTTFPLSFDKEVLVDPDPPMDLVDAKANAFDHNIVLE